MPDPDGALPHTQSAFRRAVVPITLGLGSLALLGWLFWSVFEGQREDVATARAFLTHIAAEQHTQARALMTPALAQQIGAGGLNRIFGQIEPWDHIGFSSRSSNGAGPARITDLLGVGDTVSGCESVLSIQLIGGQVDAFNVTPLCPRAGTDV
ncbi:hypothetical protein [Gymnodinialimonas sp.]